MPLYLGSNKIKIKSSGSRVLELYSTTPLISGIILKTVDGEKLIDENNLIITTIKEEE
jgi:hypothetical protein